MPRQRQDPPPAADRRPLWRVVAAVAAAAALVVGVVWLGQLAREQLRGRDRYAVAFADIDCPAPPGLSRPDFLDEVRYLSRHGERIDLLAERTPADLHAAFARHPWVEAVTGVELRSPPAVLVLLKFRAPLLAVPGTDGQRYCVTADGVVLARVPEELADGLSKLEGPRPPPEVPAGKHWGNDDVQAAAKIAGLLRPAVGELKVTPEGWQFAGRDGRKALWGSAPGAEQPGEAKADDKAKRFTARTDAGDIDLRRGE